MEFSLRSVTPADDAFLFDLYVSTRAEELAMFGWGRAEQEAFCRLQFKAKESWYAAAYEGSESSIILKDGEAVGRIIVLRTPVEFRLVDIALLTEHRGAGMGGELVRRLLEEGAAARLPVRLQVLRTSRAALLYERLGFVLCGSDQVYYHMERLPG
jgi:GNAT superfamily N-acetyltransferase